MGALPVLGRALERVFYLIALVLQCAGRTGGDCDFDPAALDDFFGEGANGDVVKANKERWGSDVPLRLAAGGWPETFDDEECSKGLYNGYSGEVDKDWGLVETWLNTCESTQLALWLDERAEAWAKGTVLTETIAVARELDKRFHFLILAVGTLRGVELDDRSEDVTQANSTGNGVVVSIRGVAPATIWEGVRGQFPHEIPPEASPWSGEDEWYKQMQEQFERNRASHYAVCHDPARVWGPGDPCTPAHHAQYDDARWASEHGYEL